MDLWVPLIAPCILAFLGYLCGKFSGCLCEKVDYMRKLDANLSSLEISLARLIVERNVVRDRVSADELEGGQEVAPDRLVAMWLLQVETIEKETKLLIDKASGQDTYSQDASPVCQPLSTFRCCWSSTCFLGEQVSDKLDEVRSLSSKDFKDVTEQAPLHVVQRKDCDPTFGLEMIVEKTWNILRKEETRILRIYGMGGIGKTTLLTRINNKFHNCKSEYDVVIWIKVSKDADIMKIRDDNEDIQVVDIGKIQDGIGKRLRICDKNWCTKSQEEKADVIGRALTAKSRFVLLLDDLWKEVNLSTIGIPVVGKQYKVVFTTRSKEVYESMKAKEDIEVQCLAEKDAWDLFKKQAGYEGTNGKIFDIAKKVAAKCCGLPLALQVIGQTLASKATEDEWLTALHALESFPSEMKGTEKGIFQVLKLSYDNLEERDAKLCFQYCALFPKTYNIKRDDLVEYWIGEGIIGARCRRQIAKYRGDKIIDNLVKAFLLLKDGEYVYMHDMIRDMALWIVSKFENGETYVVEAGAGISKLPYVTDWTTVTKMSLMKNEIKSIPNHPEFPDLVTLFLQHNKLVEIVGKFFVVMSTLVVLDLSWNHGITELPQEISMLVALRYLSLSGTRIKDLPDGLGELTQLIHLDLESTSNLQRISLSAGLLNLQVLRFYDSKASLDTSLLEILERLGGLHLLTITVREVDVFNIFLESELAGKTQGLYLEGIKMSGVSFAATFGALGSLCTLQMASCDFIESDTEWEEQTRHQSPTPSNQITPSNTWFNKLSAVVLLSCEGLRDLTWIIYATNLESLSISLSPMMEELISKEKAKGVIVDKPFQKLQVLHLEYLPKLKCIQRSPLSFPSLKKVDIEYCSMLPVNSTCIERIDDLCIESTV